MDFEVDSKVNVSEEKLKELSKLAVQQLTIEQEIENKKNELEQLTKILKSISEGKIPELMQEIGMSEFSLLNGAKVKVKPFYSGTVNEENILAVSNWLNEKGHSALLKKEIILNFGKDSVDNWQEVISYLKTEAYKNTGIEVSAQFKQGIHHATLNAFLKEQIEAGKELPLELFKAYIGNRTKITL